MDQPQAAFALIQEDIVIDEGKFDRTALGMTIGVVIVSLFIGAVATIMPRKNSKVGKEIVANADKKGKTKYVSSKRNSKKEKKASFLDESNKI